MKKILVRTGRYGYYGPNTAGISIERFFQPKRKSRAEVVRPIIERLIKKGDIDQAFDIIWNQPWTYERKEQLTGFFIPELVS